MIPVAPVVKTRTACSYCGVGCGITVTSDAATGAALVAVSGDRAHPANAGRLCTKGATHLDLMRAPGRLTSAHVRPERTAEAVPVPLADAVAEAGGRLQAVIDEHGPDAVAVYVSGQMTIEAQYLANKLVKGFIGSRHIESNSRLCMASAGTGYAQSLGADGPPGSYEDLDHADLFLVIGSNMADCHPILYLRMAERLKAGARLIVVDPRRTATAERADLYLPIRPGTDLALLNGLLHLLVEGGHIDEEFIAAHTEGWERMPSFLADYPPDRVAAATGLPEADIRLAAQWIAESDDWMSLWTMGLNQSTQGTWHTNALCNLHLATGAICRTGSGPFSLTGQPNAMGGREMGYMGPGLPGQRSVFRADDRAFAEEQWGLEPGSIRAESGTGTIDMFRSLAAGDIKAVWIICTNPVASVANRRTVIEGLEAAELVIVQDVYAETATAAYADILLPAALWVEGEGVTVGSDRTMTLTPQVIEPPGDATPDWRLVRDVARAMGHGRGFAHASAAEVFDELRGFWNPRTGWDVRGVSHDRLRTGPVQWPAPHDDADRHPLRYVNDGVSQTLHRAADGSMPALAFPTPSRRAQFLPRPHLDPVDLPDDDHPFVLNTGRLQHQWHTMTKTGRIERLRRLNPDPFIEVHPEDAAALGIADGDDIELASRRGRAVLPAVVTDRVRRGTCFAPFHWNDVHGDDLAVNAVTSDAVDAESLQPAFKFAAVALRGLGRSRPETVAPAAVAPGAHHLRVLWGSQTGNAEATAQQAVATLTARGIPAHAMSMAEVSATGLRDAGRVLMVTSTFGDGEPPDNAARLWGELARGDAPDLTGVDYAVLAMGDASYDDFCAHGRQLDDRLSALGATSLLPRIDSEVDDAASVAAWLDRVATALGATTAAAVPLAAAPFTRAAPGRATLGGNDLLTSPASAKEVRRIALDVPAADVAYEAGDAFGVVPAHPRALVEEWLEATGLSADAVVELDGAEMAFGDALTTRLDITAAEPLLSFLAARSADPVLARLVRPDARTRREQHLWRMQGVDLVREFPVRADAAEWAAALPRLKPRQYSISSSPKSSPGIVELTVSVVRFETETGRRRGGVASSLLADAAPGADIPVFLQRQTGFRPPADPAARLIMIGPGTGIAPFRGFLHDRRADGHTGSNWLFFGAQHEAHDFLYRDELLAMRRDGFLTRLDLAFSRDQRLRVYVQDRMAEHGRELWRWLEDGAHVYVCGDASRMAKDVEDALVTIVQRHGGMPQDAAAEYVARLAADGRYARDVY